LLKLAPKTVISISAFCSRYWVGVIFFGLAEGMFASPTLDALVNAAASFSAAVGNSLYLFKMSRHRQSFLRRPLHMPGEKQEKAADERHCCYWNTLRAIPAFEKGKAEFERAQKVEETFHKDFDGIDFASRRTDG
jgi:hypothetical protein